MNVFLKAAVVLFLVFASWVEARADRVSNADPATLCQLFTNFASNGALQHQRGAPMVFKYITSAERDAMIKSGMRQSPTDGIYMIDDGDLTENEKRFWEDAAELGWKHPGEDFSAHCPKGADLGGFTRVASSEGLAAPFTSLERFCAFRKEIMTTANQFKNKVSADELLTSNPLPPNWSDEFRAIADKDIRDLYDFIGNSSVFIDGRYQSCMHPK